MNLALNRHTRKLIEDRVRSGDYATPEDVITAALRALQQHERLEFAPGELDALIREGEASESLDGEAVFAELRKLGETYRQSHMK